MSHALSVEWEKRFRMSSHLLKMRSKWSVTEKNDNNNNTKVGGKVTEVLIDRTESLRGILLMITTNEKKTPVARKTDVEDVHVQ